jgi:hypothetical protein
MSNIIGTTGIIGIDITQEQGKKLIDYFDSIIRLEEIYNLDYAKYGKDLEMILFYQYIYPYPELKSNIKSIPSYSKKEKSIGINIIIEDIFVGLSEAEKVKYVLHELLGGLNKASDIIRIKKLDTKIDLLIQDITEILKKEGLLTDSYETIESINTQEIESENSEDETTQFVITLKMPEDRKFNTIDEVLDYTDDKMEAVLTLVGEEYYDGHDRDTSNIVNMFFIVPNSSFKLFVKHAKKQLKYTKNISIVQEENNETKSFFSKLFGK